MKRKKICAAITLVAFILTMMPMMAFAASASNSSISVDDGSAKADGKDTLTFIVDLDENLNTKQVEGSADAYQAVAKENVARKTVLAADYYNNDGTVTYQTNSDYDASTEYYRKIAGTQVQYEKENSPQVSTEKYLTTTVYEADQKTGNETIIVSDPLAADSAFTKDDGKNYVAIAEAKVESEEALKQGTYYTKSDKTYTKDDSYDISETYYTITDVADPQTYQKLTQTYYNDNGTVTYNSGDKYESLTDYYNKKEAVADSYEKVEADSVAKKEVLTKEYFNNDGTTTYTVGSDYNDGTAYYEKVKATETKATQYLYIWAERNGTYSDADLLSLSKDSGYSSYLALDYSQISKGETKVYVKSNTAGTITLKAYIITSDSKPSFPEVYNGSSSFLKTALVGNGATGKFNATSSEITVSGTVTPYDSGKAQTSKDFAKDTTYNGNLNANNGVDYYYVSLKFQKGGSKLVDEEVSFSIDKNGGTINKESDKTSATGAVNFKVSASKGGTYTVTVDCGTYSESFKVVFGSADITKIQVVSSTEEVIAVDQNEEVAVELVAYDANGNTIKADNTVANSLNEKFNVEVTKAPADSSMQDEVLSDPFKYNGDYSSNIYLSFEPDAVGSYTLKIYNNVTGVSDYAYLTAKEFGKITSATISYDSASYTLGSTTEAPTVKVVDENGVTKTASKGSLKFSYSGIGVASFNSSNGKITFKDNSDYVGNKITVNVVVSNKVAASTTVTIGNEASYLGFKEANGAVGEEVTVTGSAYDYDGKLSAIGGSSGDYTVKVQNALITSKPEGSNATIDASNFENNNFLTTGSANVIVTCNKEGKVVGNVVLEITNNTTNKTTYLAGVVTVNFGKYTDEDKTYSKNVTMIIGSKTFVFDGGVYTTDVAPFISNGRTMIAIRALAESTGADVEYNDATRTVTITGKDLEATMVIGSNVLTVNGETTVMDVAASIVDGRTVIPVRYAAEILGYDFELTYDNKGNIVAVTMYQE